MTPWTSFAFFALAYLGLVVGLLVAFHRRRKLPRCHRCGSHWRRTERGGQWHLCVPNRRVVP